MKSSGLYLWLITGILGYAHKIPYIGRIVTLLGIWYGRTTWWKILIKIRKVFIVINAIIGVYVVFKSVGFSTDNLFAGFVGLGHTYFEILFNFTKRLFTWFFDLFDMKIVPNVPGDTPSFKKPNNSGLWFPKGIDSSWNQRLPKLDNIPSDWFKPGFNFNIGTFESTPWYKDWSTIYWIGGILGSMGMAYITYKLYSDPTIITNFIKNTFFNTDSKGKGVQPDIQPDITATSPTNSDISQGTKTIGSSIAYFFNKTYHSLNPYNWFTSSNNFEINHQIFLRQQTSAMDYDARLWPFTEVNPYFSWHERLKIYLLGESTIQNEMRLQARSSIWEQWMPQNQAGPSGSLIAPLVQSTPGSPSISGIGLNIRPVSFLNDIESLNIASRLSTVPNTPTIIPTVLPNQSPLIDPASWDIPTVLENTVESTSSSANNSPLVTQQVLDSVTENLASPSTVISNSPTITQETLYPHESLYDTFINPTKS